MFKEKAIKGLICLGAIGVLASSSWAIGKKPAVSKQQAASREQKGTQTVLVEIQGQTQIRYLELSPAKNEAVYVSVDNEKKSSIGVINLDSKKKKNLIDKGYNYSRPRWSHDGKKIICSFANSPYEGIDREMFLYYSSLGNIWIIDVEKEIKTRLPLNNKYSHINPVPSPNGKMIAYSSTEDCNYKVKLKSGQEVAKWAYGLHIMDADGSKRKVLTDPKTNLWEDIPIEWSLDEKKIIYYAGGFERPNIGIYSFNIDTQEKKQIVYTWDYDVHPETEKIVYISPKDRNIWITNFDGSYKKQITSDSVDKGGVQWVSSQEIIAKFWESDTNSNGRVNRDDIPTLKIINWKTGKVKIILRERGIQKIKRFPKGILVIQNNKIVEMDSLSSLIMNDGGR